MGGPEYLPWSQAMEQALYGPSGFYTAGAGPAAHFRTSVHASPLFAEAIAELARQTDAVLGHPGEFALVDLGAGGGELSAAVHDAVRGEPFADRLRLVAVDLAARPAGLPAAVEWRSTPPGGVTGLLVANEWLDNVPCDVAEYHGGRWRAVEVAADGTERLGGNVPPDQQAWLAQWWPPAGEGARAEVGLRRDTAWREAAAAVRRGVAIAVDYAHSVHSRPPQGTLAGYARGGRVEPVPDGTGDITAHVALDACAAAVDAADWTVRSAQGAVLRALGVSGARPPLSLASEDPRGYLRALSLAASAAELTDPSGLGGFGWLAHGFGTPVPPALARVADLHGQT